MCRTALAAIAALIVLTASCATKSGSAAQGEVEIELVDSQTLQEGEIYRHVRWRGENYGTEAFQTAVRGSARSIVLLNPNEVSIRCVAALSGSLAVPASTRSRAEPSPIAPSTEKPSDACQIAYDTPRPTLAAGQYYVERTAAGIAVEGHPATTPIEVSNLLRKIGASAIVMRSPTIGDLLCYSAVAAAASVRLYEVNREGTLSVRNASGSNTENSCRQ